MIELLLALALVGAVQLGLVLAGRWILGARAARWTPPSIVIPAAAIAAVALLLDRGGLAAFLCAPWLILVGGVAVAGAGRFVGDLALRRPATGEPWRLAGLVAFGFLAVGAVWLLVDRAGLRPFGFDRTIVLLTAVHFHVAGFVLTVAGVLALRSRPSRSVAAALVALVAGTPLTALGFFGLPIVGWLGAVLVATAGLGIGIATLRIALTAPGRSGRLALGAAGLTLLVTMPMAIAYATGSTFGVSLVALPVMAGIHGTLNVVGFAIPAMTGWSWTLQAARPDPG